MTETSFDPEFDGADLCGLPKRAASLGRDQLERIASEYLDQLRSGTAPEIEQFAQRHPSLAAEIRDFLPLVAAMEDWKRHHDDQALQQPLPKRFEIVQLGDCRIVREIARGGMGVVFEAEQGAIGRRVAVKLLPWRFPRNSKWSEQFVREARIAAGLQHPNIVPVFSFGEQDERYYYVMQLVEGVGLDRLIDRWRREQGQVAIEDLIGEFHPGILRPDTVPNRAQRFLRHDSWQQLGKIAAQIASALRYAHRQGTLHRDIKPANLLIDLQGKVWITDFGLAVGQDRFLADDLGPLAGTVRYMAPERFSREGDERSDLYSFGATLYELCTLRPVFEAQTRRQLLAKIRRGKLTPPRAIRPEIPAPLERIIVKAMARDLKVRYQTADQLHADLLRFLNSRNQRRGRSLWRQFRRWF